MKTEDIIRKEITIAIPALNEAGTLADIITECKNYSDDIMVIDGHSTDATVKIAKSLDVPVIFDNRKGKGDAIRSVIPHLNRNVTVFVDADGSHDPNDIPRLVMPILNNEADHVSGSRLLGGSSELHGGFDE